MRRRPEDADREIRGLARFHIRVPDGWPKTYASTITCNCLRSMELLPDPADHPVFKIETTAT